MKKMDCDIAVLGGGPAGYVAAIRAVQLGAKAILIEEKDLGGVCMNVGCIPTKALLKTSETAVCIKRSRELGIESHIDSIDWNLAVDRKNRVVKNLNIGIEQLLREKGVVVIKGRGNVESEHKLLVQTAEEVVEINCQNLILATGASPMIPPIQGIHLDGVITSNEALNLDSLPQSMAIIGAGVIGLEFAAMLLPLGVKIIVIESEDRILKNEDSEIAAELLKIMKRQGVSFKLSAAVTKIEKTQEGLAIAYTCGEKEYVQAAGKVLVAVGRKLNSDIFPQLPLVIENGAVMVDEHMETNIRGVYAAGDLIGGKLLAHLAFMEGRVAAENALGINTKINYNAVPSCIYTDPEVASVGMNEEAAKKGGLSPKVGRFDFRNNGRALTLSERDGFVKVIADEENTIIGAQILGANASELISELTLALALKAKANDLADLIHPHPALGEAIWEACADILGRAIHK